MILPGPSWPHPANHHGRAQHSKLVVRITCSVRWTRAVAARLGWAVKRPPPSLALARSSSSGCFCVTGAQRARASSGAARA